MVTVLFGCHVYLSIYQYTRWVAKARHAYRHSCTHIHTHSSHLVPRPSKVKKIVHPTQKQSITIIGTRAMAASLIVPSPLLSTHLYHAQSSFNAPQTFLFHSILLSLSIYTIHGLPINLTPYASDSISLFTN